jgi:hypothetical protein
MTHEERMNRILHGFRYLQYAFRDVVVSVRCKDGTRTELGIPGVVYSEYENGPSLFALADWAAYFYRNYEIEFVGFVSATPLGRQVEPVAN